MSNINDVDVIHTLEQIKNNPLCDSKNMDGFIVKDLLTLGYIEAIDVTTDDSNGIPEFIEIRITLSGKNAVVKHRERSKKPDKNREKNKDWGEVPFGKIAINTISTVLAALVMFLLYRHFGIS